MNTTQLTALCQRYQGILLDADNEVVHIAVVDAPSHELLDALHFATTRIRQAAQAKADRLAETHA